MKAVILSNTPNTDFKQQQFKKYQTPADSSSKITKAMLYKTLSNFSDNKEYETEKSKMKIVSLQMGE